MASLFSKAVQLLRSFQVVVEDQTSREPSENNDLADKVEIVRSEFNLETTPSCREYPY